MWSRSWRRIRRLIIERILHLNDTPHRIAFGVFLGFFVGWTPTLGAQILIYWLLAYVLRANRVSGVLPVLLTNPITAVPVYAFNWKIGQWLLKGGGIFGELSGQAPRAELDRFVAEFSIAHIFQAQFWRDFGPAIKGLGTELIVGCLVVGLICGILGYVATFYGVLAYRKRRQTRALSRAAA
ncbi:MAG: DUF2062 domain-containing protein [Phycisphaerales bacterium]|nr:DUF2062 domain-containing protein [Phycisphaerales bacterium]